MSLFDASPFAKMVFILLTMPLADFITIGRFGCCFQYRPRQLFSLQPLRYGYDNISDKLGSDRRSGGRQSLHYLQNVAHFRLHPK